MSPPFKLEETPIEEIADLLRLLELLITEEFDNELLTDAILLWLPLIELTTPLLDSLALTTLVFVPDEAVKDCPPPPPPPHPDKATIKTIAKNLQSTVNLFTIPLTKCMIFR